MFTCNFLGEILHGNLGIMENLEISINFRSQHYSTMALFLLEYFTAVSTKHHQTRYRDNPCWIINHSSPKHETGQGSGVTDDTVRFKETIRTCPRLTKNRQESSTSSALCIKANVRSTTVTPPQLTLTEDT